MLALFCPTAIAFDGVPGLASAAASSLRRRRVLEHLAARLLVLALELQLELTLRFPTRVRAVAQACSVLLFRLGELGFDVGSQAQCRYGIRQAPRCARLNRHQRVVCMQGTATRKVRCVARGIRPRSACAMDHHELGDSCRQCILRQHCERLRRRRSDIVSSLSSSLDRWR